MLYFDADILLNRRSNAGIMTESERDRCAKESIGIMKGTYLAIYK